MAKLYAKHEQQNISLMDFSGGLNTLVSAENLQENELKTAENFEHDTRTGRFKVVDGVRKLFEDKEFVVTSLFVDEDRQEILFSTRANENELGRWLKKVSYEVTGDGYETIELTGDISSLAKLTGYKEVTYVKFGNDVLIASGGKLQYYNGSLHTIISPNADYVMTRFGRVVIFNSDSDYLYYSSVGDATSDVAWTDDTDNDSSSKSVQIGYKDGYKITAIAPLSTDILVFKDNGTLYRISNEYPDWVVQEVSRNAHCCNQKSVCLCGNDVFFAGRNGFSSASTVQEYGSVKTMEAGRKVNKLFISLLKDDECKMWKVVNKDQILIRPNATDGLNYIFIFNYQTGAFTLRRCMMAWSDVARVRNFDLVSAGNYIGVMDSSCKTEFGVEMYACLETKVYSSLNYFLIKRVMAGLSAITQGYGRITVGKLTIDIAFPNSSDVVLLDNDTAYTDEDGLGDTDGDEDSYTKRCNMRRKSFNFMLEIYSGIAQVKSFETIFTEV